MPNMIPPEATGITPGMDTQSWVKKIPWERSFSIKSSRNKSTKPKFQCRYWFDCYNMKRVILFLFFAILTLRTSSTILNSMRGLMWIPMRRRWTVSIVVSLASCKRSYIQGAIRPLVLWWMLPLLWRDFNVTRRMSGSVRGWSLGLLVTDSHRRYRLWEGCPITLRVDSHLIRLSRLTRHLPLSTVHLLSRCNSLKDIRFCLVRDRGTS